MTEPTTSSSQETELLYKSDEGPYSVTCIEEIILRDEARRKDLPIRVYAPDALGTCPVIVFSHGGGGSKDGYRKLSIFLATHGYVSIHPTHADSLASWLADPDDPALKDPEVLRQRLAGNPERQALLRSPAAWKDRVKDLSFVLESIGEIESRAGDVLVCSLDGRRVGIGGHSLGAYCAQLLGGATVIFDGEEELSLRDKRAEAVLILSGQGRGQQGLHERSWAAFDTPLLNVTGSLDRGALGQGAAWKCEPFELAPPGNKYQLFIEGADHGLGGISGRPQATSRHNPNYITWIGQAILAFWDAHLKGLPEAKAYLGSDAMVELSGGCARWSWK